MLQNKDQNNGNGSTPDDFWEFASSRGEEVVIPESLVVSPTRGRLRRRSIEPGALVAEGDPIGRVEAIDGVDSRSLVAPVDGAFLGWLAWEGEALAPGALVARIGRDDADAGIGSPDRRMPHPFGTLMRGEIHVWRTVLHPAMEPILRLRALVADDEWLRGSEMTPERSYSFVATRAALRIVLAHYIPGATPRRLKLDTASGGKLFSVDHPDLTFSVSHSGGLSAIAVSREAPVGVDVELVRPIACLEPVAERIMGGDVAAMLRSLPVGRRPRFFFSRWTRMEAALKVSGRGLTCASVASVRSALDQVWTAELRTPPGWAGAISSTESRPVLQFDLRSLTSPVEGRAS